MMFETVYNVLNEDQYQVINLVPNDEDALLVVSPHKFGYELYSLYGSYDFVCFEELKADIDTGYGVDRVLVDEHDREIYVTFYTDTDGSVFVNTMLA